MNILYDSQIFTAQIYGGISRYFCELISILSKDNTISVKLPIVTTNNHYLLNTELIKINRLLHNKRFFGKTTLIKYSTDFYTKLTLLIKSYDIFHPTYYDPYFLKYIGSKPFVVTVYDMIHELLPENFSINDISREWKEATVKRASSIIAISENTKHDLIRLYGIDEKKISVIHLASSLNPGNASPAHFPLPSRYLLFVGERSGYKNFKLFVEAVSFLMHREADLNVICAGGGGFTNGEKELFVRLNLADRILQYSVSDGVLATLYKNALAFVFPSLYEGFGIPVLEAFNCGCPAVLSNTSSLPEVGEEAARYFDPADAISMRCAIEQVIRDPELRKNLIKKGFERAKDFSWEKVARQTKDVYTTVCNS